MGHRKNIFLWKNICDFYIFQARYRNCSYIKGYITDLLDISMCKICMNSRRLLFKSKAKYSVCFTNCCANKMFPNVCRSSSVIKTFSGKLENKLQIRRLNFQKLTKLDQARLLLFDQTNPEKFKGVNKQCIIELSANLRKVAQCSVKVPTRTFS